MFNRLKGLSRLRDNKKVQAIQDTVALAYESRDTLGELQASLKHPLDERGNLNVNLPLRDGSLQLEQGAPQGAYKSGLLAGIASTGALALNVMKGNVLREELPGGILKIHDPSAFTPTQQAMNYAGIPAAVGMFGGPYIHHKGVQEKNRDKRMLGIGAAVLGTGVAAYGADSIYKTLNLGNRTRTLAALGTVATPLALFSIAKYLRDRNQADPSREGTLVNDAERLRNNLVQIKTARMNNPIGLGSTYAMKYFTRSGKLRKIRKITI